MAWHVLPVYDKYGQLWAMNELWLFMFYLICLIVLQLEDVGGTEIPVVSGTLAAQ